jgi:tellurite resistance protein
MTEKERILDQIEKIETRLNNSNFIQKANQNIISTEKKKLIDFRQKLELLSRQSKEEIIIEIKKELHSISQKIMAQHNRIDKIYFEFGLQPLDLPNIIRSEN